MDRRELDMSPAEIAADSLGFFRWGRIAGKVLVTNDAGDWGFFTEPEFNDLLAGRIVEGHPRFLEAQSKGLLRDGLDLDALAERVAQRNGHVHRGPYLHVVTLTLRCDDACSYCRALRPTPVEADCDMSVETAEKIVNLALQSTSPSMTFEFQAQGGEPLRNFDVLRRFVELARSSNSLAAGKTLSFRLISNCTGMTEEAAEWLIANDVQLCTSLDGPANLHDANRKWKHGNRHAEVVRWIEYFTRRYAELGRDAKLWHVDALLTTTRQTLGAWREVVDEYVTRGLRTIDLRPLSPVGFARDAWSTVGYTPVEYHDFYRHALDYILELNGRGVEIMERTATIFLTKILTAEDPGIVDVQSPVGAGTGQIAYNVDGRVFPCDEARLVDATGDSIFELGDVGGLTASEITRHPTVRAIAAASLLDTQPMCADCWNKPFCGFSPVVNFATQGDLFGQRPHCFQCKDHMAVSTKLFESLANESDTGTAEIFKRWTTLGPQLASDRRALMEAP